jgi:hypothetical protein
MGGFKIGGAGSGPELGGDVWRPRRGSAVESESQSIKQDPNSIFICHRALGGLDFEGLPDRPRWGPRWTAKLSAGLAANQP